MEPLASVLMAPTVLGNVVAFFDRLGVYDVVLPFLLVFTVVYGILERSKVFGTQGGNDGEEGSTKKNLNAMVAWKTKRSRPARSKFLSQKQKC